MKQISKWFRGQTFAMKLTFTFLVIAVSISAIFTFGKAFTKEPEALPDPTIPPIQTTEPTPTITPSEPAPQPTEDPFTESGEDLVPLPDSTFSTNDLDSAYAFSEDAARAYCEIDIEETSAQRIQRLSSWFDPTTDAMRENDIIPIVQVRQCSSLGAFIYDIDPETGYLLTKVTLSSYIVYIFNTEETDGDKPLAQNSYDTYNFELTMVDGKWIVMKNS